MIYGTFIRPLSPPTAQRMESRQARTLPQAHAMPVTQDAHHELQDAPLPVATEVPIVHAERVTNPEQQEEHEPTCSDLCLSNSAPARITRNILTSTATVGTLSFSTLPLGPAIAATYFGFLGSILSNMIYECAMDASNNVEFHDIRHLSTDNT